MVKVILLSHPQTFLALNQVLCHVLKLLYERLQSSLLLIKFNMQEDCDIPVLLSYNKKYFKASFLKKSSATVA